MKPGNLWLKKVAAYYDSKKRDLNWRLAADGIIHHHNGLVPGKTSFLRKMKTAGTAAGEALIHRSETDLSLFGFKFLDCPRKRARLLDAGCGRGGSSLLLAGLYPLLRITGVTLSAYQAAAARAAARARGLDARVKFIRASMLSLPFPENMFDRAWACESTEHVPSLSAFFSEMARVCVPGARLVVIAGVRNPGHPGEKRFTRLANKAYFLKLHTEKEYLDAGASRGWKLAWKKDLTRPAANYWNMRAMLKKGSGTEFFAAPAFTEGALLYRLYAYDLVK